MTMYFDGYHHEHVLCMDLLIEASGIRIRRQVSGSGLAPVPFAKPTHDFPLLELLKFALLIFLTSDLRTTNGHTIVDPTR